MGRLIQNAIYSNKVDGLTAHTHDCYEIIYVKKGKLKVDISGESYVANAPCIIFISRLESHSLTVLSEEYERTYVCISPMVASEYIRSYTLLSVLSSRHPLFHHVLSVKKVQSKIEEIFSNILVEFDKPKEYSNEFQSSLLLQLLILIKRTAPEMFMSENERSAGAIFKIQCKLEEECANKISLEDLAQEYHMSSSHLSHLFKRVTGYSIMQYLLYCRLALARRLLRDTDKSISQIAECTGFTDQSNFSRYFKRENGCTPMEYRSNEQI